MAWTLALILLIIGYFLVATFSRAFRIFQRKSFVYPSEAEIDQTLPPEIIETILANTNLSTLYNCALVSKYWRHHAEKEHIIKEASKNEKPMRVSIRDLWTDISKSNRYNHIQQYNIEFLQYNEKVYKPQWNAFDRQYVEKNGKTFIDVEYSTAIKLKEVLSATPGDELMTRYVVRTRLRYSYSDKTTRYFVNTKSYEHVYFENNTLPSHITDNLYSNAVVEFVEELANFKGSIVRISNPSHMRILDNRPMLGGVPLDGTLFALMYLLFTPCLIRDLWNGSEDAKYYITLIAANSGLIGTLVVSVIYLQEYVRQNQASKRILSTGVFGVLIVAIILYKWTIEFGFHLFIEAGSLLYGLLVVAILEKWKHGKMVLFISFCLVVSIGDWKLTVDSIRSGDFWWSLLYNIMQHFFVLIYAQCIAIASYVLLRRNLNRSALRVDRELIKLFGWNLVSIIYMTCAAPYTTFKVHL